MTNRQTSVVMFVFAMIVSFIFLAVLVRVNYDLTAAGQSNIHLQKQIDQLKVEQKQLQAKISSLEKADERIARDVDVTQDLQRKQAQVIVDIKKGRKK